jgi:uncharacterized protein (UPF0276 family)
VVDRIKKLQDYFQLPIIIENIASYLNADANEMDEIDFINAVLNQSQAKLLLDVNNLFINAHNHQYDANEFVLKINPDHVAQYHLAGYTESDNLIIDTHDTPVNDKVWELFEATYEIIGNKPACIEWDSDIPSWDTLIQETDKISRHLPVWN